MILPALLAAAAIAGASDPAPAALALRFEGLADKGQVVLAVFDTARGWRERVEPVRSAKVPVHAGVAEARFEGLHPGPYAVMAYHDRNGNGRLDTLPIGMPTEPYGFSNDARAPFGPPSWGKASFEIGAGEARTMTVRLK